MADVEKPLPDWLLERLAQDELAGPLEQEARRRLQAEPDGAARLDALGRADQAFAARPEATANLARLTALARAAAQPRSRGLRPPLWIGAAAALAVALVGVRASLRPVGSSDTRIKGLQPVLAVYRRAGRGSERLANGVTARAGDEVQLGYTAAGRRYGAILSIDGRGGVTLHFPESAAAPPEALRLSQPRANAIGPVLLDQAAALDDAPSFERFFFVTSNRPIDLGGVLAAARALARDSGAANEPLELPHGLEQASFLLRKASP